MGIAAITNLFHIRELKTNKPLKKKAILTQRELEVMQLVKQGLTNKAVAGHLNISAETVKKHLQNIFEKLDAGNKIEALNRLNGN